MAEGTRGQPRGCGEGDGSVNSLGTRTNTRFSSHPLPKAQHPPAPQSRLRSSRRIYAPDELMTLNLPPEIAARAVGRGRGTPGVGEPTAAGLGRGPEPGWVGVPSAPATVPAPKHPSLGAGATARPPRPHHAAEIAPRVPEAREAAQGRAAGAAEPQPSPQRCLKRFLLRIRSAAPQPPPFHKYNPGSAGYNLVIATPGHI